MKKFPLILFAFIVFYGAQAKVLTVSNRTGASAQFTTVTAAIAAAAAGDTIYIQGSETSYGDITLDKRLTIIGTGHNPEKENALISVIGTINLGTGTSHNLVANGSTIIGLKVNNIQAYHIIQHNITIKRCDVSQITAYDNQEGINKDWIIENNIIFNVTLGSSNTAANNFLIRNNIIRAVLTSVNGSVITNNVFLGKEGNLYSFSEVFNSIIQNNIFFDKTPQGAHNSTFNNNITFSSTNNALPYGTNSGSLNKVNVDPQFTSYPGGAFSYDHDYHLKESSPGKNAGTDGTDIGIYGGMGFSETGEPPIPTVRSFFIQNGVIAPNGKLKIQFKAEAKN